MRAGQRVRRTAARPPELSAARPLRNPAVEIFLWSRAAIWAAALFVLFALDGSRNPRVDLWDDPAYTRDLGAVTDVWARWDGVWFLRLAQEGYGARDGDAAFFPLYPGLVAGLGRVLAGHYVLAGIAVSLAAGAAAFALLYRLAEPRLGADGARRSLLYLAVFPTSLFLGAVYSESLYLLLAIAVFLLAERGRLLEASSVAGLALLTRPSAIALLPPLALLAWRARGNFGLARLAAAPAVFAAYPLFLWWRLDDPFASLDAQRHWDRHLSPLGPLGGVWHGLRAAWAGARQLAAGGEGHIYWPQVTSWSPLQTAAINLSLLAFLALFVVLTLVAWRRFGAPYGLFCITSLALPLSVPSDAWPLQSLPRYGLTVFPFFLALAALGGRPRLHAAVLSVSALFLGIAVTQWALWQWVA
ncbi:MAG: mannosyltransferase family protein [Gaiellaceae bacterium]